MTAPIASMLEIPMADFFRYVISNIKYVLDMMLSTEIAQFLGISLLHVLIAFWIMWIAVNMFVIRPNAVPIDNIILSAKNQKARTESRRMRETEKQALEAHRNSFEYYSERRQRNEAYDYRYRNGER